MGGKSIKIDLTNMDTVDIYKMVLKGDKIKKFPNGFWKNSEAKNNAIKCTYYMIKELLKWNDEDIKSKLNNSVFKKHRLGGMLEYVYKASTYEALNDCFPDKYMPWELISAPQGYWNNKENAREATRWLLKKINCSDEELKKILSQKIFYENGLRGMLNCVYNYSPYEAIDDIMPGKFKPWEFTHVSAGYWNNEENTKDATRWLIQKLNWTEEDIINNLSVEVFRQYKLGGMLNKAYNDSPYEAINALYPNKFKPWQFKSVPNSFWINRKNARDATKWMIEQLGWNDDEIKEKLTKKIFKQYKLSGMLTYVYKGSPYKALNDLYPSKFKKNDFKSYHYNITKRLAKKK